MEIKDKRILVTGSDSFLGESLIPMLKEKEAEVLIFSDKDYDLRKKEDVKRLFDDFAPEIVVHLAANNGGFAYTKENPEKIFYDNVMMNTLVQREALERGVEKFVGVGSAAAYPKSVELPLKEENLWKGGLSDSHACIGLAKKIMLGEALVVFSLGLVVAGAFSNLYDRLAYGYVVDFINIFIWPTFNLADLMIVGGLLCWVLLERRRTGDRG